MRKFAAVRALAGFAFMHSLIPVVILIELKVVSINMWGTHLDFMSMFDRSQVKSRSIPFLHECTLGCDREERMEAVGQRIKEGNYDFILFQEVWDNKDLERIWNVIGKTYFITNTLELASHECKDTYRNQRPRIAGYYRGFQIPMFKCSGLVIASKYGDFVETKFTPFNHIGSSWLDVIGCPNLECMVSKGMGKVSLILPLDKNMNITVDLFTIHTQSDPVDIGEQRHRRMNQLRQVLPEVLESTADLTIIGGDFNDVPFSEPYNFMTEQLNDTATQILSNEEYATNIKYRTYGNTANTYTGYLPNSERATLDYIFYKSNGDKVDVKAKDFQILNLKGGPHISLSDHEQVYAVFEVTPKK